MRHPPFPKLVATLAACLSIAGCGTISRSPPNSSLAPPAPAQTGLDAYRFAGTDDRRILAWIADWTAARERLGLDGVRAMAISGGGANGAYGAGVLVGWSQTGTRPQFDLVTGVSTGALIAPLAFLGPRWDQRLTAAYHDPKLSLITKGRLSALVHPSLYGSATLSGLVNKYVDDMLLEAIAAEDEKGRRLLVATTNLDAQQTEIWDLGAIAKAAQSPGDNGRALQLFRKVLLASASIPGVFPPAFISSSSDRSAPAEMDVDGGISTPFFLVPEAMVLWRPEWRMRPTELYVIINGKPDPTYAVTAGGAAPILLRTFDTLGRAVMRGQLTAARTFAERNGGKLSYTAIPADIGADPFNFSQANMGSLYELGYGLAASGKAFHSVDDAPSATSASTAQAAPPLSPQTP